jgi:isocitrate lyase
MSRQKEEAPDFGPEPHSEVAQWVKRIFQTLQERDPDPVEDAEREAHFETWKRKGAKK